MDDHEADATFRSAFTGGSQGTHRIRDDGVPMSVSSDAHRVLVVDDEPNVVDVVAMALRFQGFAVESAGCTAGPRSS